MKRKVETIENRWDILYNEYPEVYDEFAMVKKHPSIDEVLKQHFDFKNKILLDIGSGTGDSSFPFANLCKEIIGIEIEDEMRFIGNQYAIQRKIKNISFIQGDAMDIPLKANSIDISMAITLPLFIPDDIRNYVNEATRVTKKDGYVINVGIAPLWYGGEYAPIILGEARITEEDTEGVTNKILCDEFGFEYFDVDMIQEYGSLDKIVSTYGFIFGSNVINYLKEHHLTSVHWRFRVHYKKK
ncbi:MAG: class I SAM-dependent methyltransferase [Candidatus Izemoplasmatales bacterium]